MKYFLPTINIIIAAALFFGFTSSIVIKAPLAENGSDITKSTGGIQALLARQAGINEALNTADKLNSKIEELGQKYNSFNSNDLLRLDQLLPDNANSTQLIIDINSIARKNGMVIKNVKADTSTDKNTSGISNTQSNTNSTLAVTNSRLGVMSLAFSVTGTYDTYKRFLADLASSLRIVDISSVTFNTDDKGIYNYDVSLKTYWLK